jgi:hypothetical protein
VTVASSFRRREGKVMQRPDQRSPPINFTLLNLEPVAALYVLVVYPFLPSQKGLPLGLHRSSLFPVSIFDASTSIQFN